MDSEHYMYSMDKNMDYNVSFELTDFNFLDMLSDDFFEEELTTSNNNVTSTQVLGIATQDLFKVNEQTSETFPENKDVPAVESRFGLPVSAKELKERQSEAVPKKTRQNNNWAVGIWRDWADNRNDLPETRNEPGYPIPLDVGLLNDYALLDYWLQRFILEIRRKDGKFYPPNTLTQIANGIQRYLRHDVGFKNLCFYKEDDSTFAEFRKTLDAKMKQLTAMGIGVNVNSSDPITPSDELKFWETKVFDFGTAVGLSNAVFFYNGKTFGFRGYQEHYDCQADQFDFGVDHLNNKSNYVRFTPRIRKNAQGGLKQKKINTDPIIHYDNPENPHSVFKLYQKYLSLIPGKGSFYRKPLGGKDENQNPRYSVASIPQREIKQMLKRFCEEADVSVEGRKITNHSARVTCCTALYNEKFTDKAVTSRSKHRSNAVRAYQRENFKTLSEISNVLDTPFQPSRTSVDNTNDSQEQSNIKPIPNVTPAPNLVESLVKSEVKSPEELLKTTCEKTASTDDSLTIFVPSCVKTVVLLKEGKRFIMEI